MQEAIAGLNAAIAEHRRMSFRIGINVGDIIAKDGDIFGDGVNIAARLQTLATAGGICVSRGVRDHIRHLDSFRFEDLGEQQVKNIDRPVRAFRVIVDAGGAPDMGGTPPDPPELSTQAPVDDDALLDIALWETVRDSDRVAEFLHYLERFPDGEFAALARDRIAALSAPTTDAGGHARRRRDRADVLGERDRKRQSSALRCVFGAIPGRAALPCWRGRS